MSSIKKTPRKRPQTDSKEADLEADRHRIHMKVSGVKRINGFNSSRNQRRQVARNLRSP
ncbi:MAG: hypothetical protein AB7G93_05285 [Bdellovibrionales bacterium]